MPELLVMLAVAEWFFKRGAKMVRVYPDGMHLKGFDVDSWMLEAGFRRLTSRGRSGKCGEFQRGDCLIVLHSQSGQGDVTATIDGKEVEVETKGGCINTRHAGQLSKLRKGLSEAVGQALASPRQVSELYAVVPRHSETERLAERLKARCELAGVTIALVSKAGHIEVV